MVRIKVRRLLYLVVVFGLLAVAPAFPSVRAAGQTAVITHLTYVGTTTLGGTSDGGITDEGTSYEFASVPAVAVQIPHSGVSAAHSPAKHIPMPSANAIASSNPGLSGFNGITHRQQRFSGTGVYAGTNFSLEPPDQALCVGNNFVLEGVNDAVRVFTTSGTPKTGTLKPINQFFTLAPEIIRTTPPVFGNFTSDPRCIFDSATNHFFLTVTELDRFSSGGSFTGRTHVLIAVSQTGDPTSSWNLFVLDATDDGTNGTPSHPSCPCFGDQPLLGADANGFYISTNEFPVFTSGFNGAQIYAVSKTALEAAIPPTLPIVIQFNTGTIPTPDAGGTWFSIQPATTPPGGPFASNTEFFLSEPLFDTLDNRIAIWSLTSTDTLNSATPSPVLSHVVINSEVYAQPPDALQKDGPRPLAQVTIPLLGGQSGEKLELLAGNDFRMQQVVYAAGNLWSAINTVVQVPGDLPTTVGIAFFIVAPSLSGGTLSGSIVNQGYVAAFNASVMFPSIGVNPAGKGAMTFTLVGPNNFPSAAYTTVDAVNGAGDIHIASAGFAPEDGFTGYHFFGSPNRTARWGDYSSATADSSGNIWMGVEYIPNLPRSALADWGTFVSRLTLPP